VDVRSVAASKFNPQFNKNEVSCFLKENGVVYMHMPREFGARHNDPALLDAEGKVDFRKVVKTNEFLAGIDRLEVGIAKGFIIALMCSESEPFDCHRFSMVSYALENRGIRVEHILKNKTVIPNIKLEHRLITKYEKLLPIPDIFNPSITSEQILAKAYRLRNKDVAYSPFFNTKKQEQHS
jgi:uncharacterized protein (DUF488 family)